MIWVGVGVVCSWPWVVAWTVLLAVHYSLVVRWEEGHLERELGAPYRSYLAEVGRWFPRRPTSATGTWRFAEVLQGERSTWLAVCGVQAVFLARLLYFPVV